ncbi:MAG TPA: biotin--[acetyl-CoA-carboxylase] ligase, partial [Flavobacteriales bacterium]|nr:biotin--[acetyl-CoA-carboxylase] ligase [Flavobacteriales bacterium]
MITSSNSIINKVIKLNAIGSTNEYAGKLLQHEKTVMEGTVIWAVDQTKGKGQRGALWHSESGKNLTFSLILYPGFINIENQFILSKVVSLAIKDFIKDLLHVNMADKNYKVHVKWPNDIFVDSNKIGGILIENNVREARIISSIVGVGININQTSFPDNLPNPVSHKLLTGLEVNIEKALKAVLRTINTRYQQLKANNNTAIDRDYLKALYQFGIFANYQVKNQMIACKIIDVNKNGTLQLEKKNGDIISCDFKEVV